MSINPVHKNEDGKWYFWDEVWAHEIGPYDSKEEADKEIKKYCETVLGLGEPNETLGNGRCPRNKEETKKQDRS